FQLGQAFGSQQHFLLTHRARSPLCCGRGLPSIVRTAVRELPAGAWERVPKFRTRLYPKAPTFVKRPMPTKRGAGKDDFPRVKRRSTMSQFRPRTRPGRTGRDAGLRLRRHRRPGPGFQQLLPALLGHGPVETARSEEHTSELQSREKLVCRLLLE